VSFGLSDGQGQSGCRPRQRAESCCLAGGTPRGLRRRFRPGVQIGFVARTAAAARRPPVSCARCWRGGPLSLRASCGSRHIFGPTMPSGTSRWVLWKRPGGRGLRKPQGLGRRRFRPARLRPGGACPASRRGRRPLRPAGGGGCNRSCGQQPRPGGMYPEDVIIWRQTVRRIVAVIPIRNMNWRRYGLFLGANGRGQPAGVSTSPLPPAREHPDALGKHPDASGKQSTA